MIMIMGMHHVKTKRPDAVGAGFWCWSAINVGAKCVALAKTRLVIHVSPTSFAVRMGRSASMKATAYPLISFKIKP